MRKYVVLYYFITCIKHNSSKDLKISAVLVFVKDFVTKHNLLLFKDFLSINCIRLPVKTFTDVMAGDR